MAMQGADFMEYLQSNLAREVCRLHGWKDKVWSHAPRPPLLPGAEGSLHAKMKKIAGLTPSLSGWKRTKGERVVRLKKPILLTLVCLIALLIPVAIYAYTICNTYSDGCTICDFYSADHEYRGYMEYCN